MCTNISKNVLNRVIQFSRYTNEAKCRVYSNQTNRSLIISCHKKKFNFYSDTSYGKLEEISLASKGWNHNKSHGDYFAILPQPNTFDAPSVNFEDIKIAPPLIDVLHRSDILKATSFQAEVIPIIRSGQHTLLAAETGCGKTIAYLLPIIENLMNRKTNELNAPTALIVVPNRELAKQIGQVASILAASVGLKVNVIVGGTTKRTMLNPTFDDIDILVGTPGVIGKLSTVGIYKLTDVAYTIFDEADTLLDDSFVDRVPTIAKRVSKSQFLFVSATLPKRIPDVFAPITENLVTIKSPRLHKPLLNVAQKFLRLTKSGRSGHLLEIAKMTKGKVLVFTNKNATCNWLAMFLRENGLNCANINGEMNHQIRIDQWNQFCNGEANILSATDVGSRGLDTTQVKHVVNFDFPLYASDYIHRVGRTGRLGSSNNSKITNFICATREVKLVQEIEMAIRTNSEIPNVDGNIKALVEKNILKKMREVG